MYFGYRSIVEWFHIINMLFKTVICQLMNKAILNNIVCIALWPFVMYSNYFKIYVVLLLGMLVPNSRD